MHQSKKPLMSPAEISLFCQQAELILSSGLSLYDGIPTLAETYKDQPYAANMAEVAARVNETGSLYQGVNGSCLFPQYMQEMIRIGEMTGQEENVLHGLSLYYDREDRIRKAVRSAVTYPLVLIMMMTCVIAILVARVLPVFRSIMGDIGDLGAHGNALLSIGFSIGVWVLGIVGLVLLFALVLLFWRHFAPEKADSFIVKIIPLYAQLRRMLNATRFAGIMQMLLSSGFPLSESIALLRNVFSDTQMHTKLDAMNTALENNIPFPDALTKSSIFDPLYNRMISLGFDAGRPDQVMGKLNEVYESEMDEMITRLVNFIEPTLVALLTIVIGAIMLAVMLPMASILSGIA